MDFTDEEATVDTLRNVFFNIDIKMVDPHKFYPLAMANTFLSNFLTYPTKLLQVRLQVQVGNDVYKGTIDAMRKVGGTEGIRGLYRGFAINTLHAFSTGVYVGIFENMKYMMSHSVWGNFCGGFTAAGVSQTFSIPIEIVTQHMMLLGHQQKNSHKVSEKLDRLQTIRVSDAAKKKFMGAEKEIIRQIYQKYGARGFLKGYFVNVPLHSMTSGMWWAAFESYGHQLVKVVPRDAPNLFVQSLSAVLSGITTTVFFNPLHLVRVRMQVNNTRFVSTLRHSWREEGLGIFTKGLYVRLISSCIYSCLLIVLYTTTKQFSLKEEYRDTVRW